MTNSPNELLELIKEKAANKLALVVATDDIHLDSKTNNNQIYILELSQGGAAAGGRSGGFGQRNVSRVYSFLQENGQTTKNLDVSDYNILEGFEPPYYASAMPITLEDSSEVMVSGVVDQPLVVEYNEKFLNIQT